MSIPFRHPRTQSWPVGFVFPGEAQPTENDTVDQWISEVTAHSSQYGTDAWGANQVIGPPRVTEYGDNGMAWAPGIVETEQWLELRIERPCLVQRVRVHENYCGGAFARLKLFDSERNRFVVVVEQQPRCGQHGEAIRIEDIEIPRDRQFVTDRLRLEVDPQGRFWYEVDAIQVVGQVTPASHRRVTRLSDEQAPRMAQQISSLLFDASTSDCTLVAIGDNNTTLRFRIHRGIVAARCPLFRTMLNNAELPLGGEKVLRGIEPRLIHIILEWVYTGALKNLDRNRDLVALTTAADYFQIDDLTDYCAAVFGCLLTVQNAALLYAHFDKLCIEALKEAALCFCGQHFVAVSRTPAFQQLTQSQLLAVIARYHCENDGAETGGDEGSE